MDVQAYLARINYDGPLDRSVETLSRLQTAHLLSVPFENLDMHAPVRRTPLTERALFTRIVTERRGGLCAELNGLFAALLRGLGFHVSLVPAERPPSGKGPGPAVIKHTTLVVQLEQRLLVEVGYGLSFREPLRIDDRSEQVHHDGSAYRIEPEGTRFMVMQRAGTEWKPMYRFATRTGPLDGVVRRLRRRQTPASSLFREHRFCCLATAEGWVVLNDLKFVTIRAGVPHVRDLADEREYADMLLAHFGLTLPVATSPAHRFTAAVNRWAKAAWQRT